MKEQSKGLGDSIDKFTEKTGIKKLVKKIAGDDCGCEERKKKLNQLFPHFKNIRQFTEDELKIYDEVIPLIEKQGRITREQKTIVNTLYRSVFGNNPKWSNCASCNIKVMDNLKKVYDKSCKV